MKNLLLLGLLLTIAPAWAQTVPANGATQLTVQLPDSGRVAWRRVAQVLSGRGYGIKASDQELLTLSTEPRPVKRAGEVSLNASVRGRVLLLSGRFDTHLGGGASPITHRGAHGSPFLVAWQEMQAVADEMTTSAPRP